MDTSLSANNFINNFSFPHSAMIVGSAPSPEKAMQIYLNERFRKLVKYLEIFKDHMTLH